MSEHSHRTVLRLAGLLGLITLCGVLAGCGVGKDAVVQGSQYSFVSPGGKTEFFYPEGQRQAAPDLSGDSLTQPGHQIHISDYPGKVVVINVWGSWCGPCRGEAPELQQVFNQTGASGVQLVGIDVKDDRSQARDFVHANQLTYPSIYDFPARTLLALKNYPRSAVPSTIVLDRKHRVAAVYLQAVLAGDLLPEVQKLSAES